MVSLRIGFDGRALASPAAGVRRYTHELFGAMAARHDVAVVAVGAPPGVRLPDGVERGPSAASLPSNLGWMTTGLPRAARQARLDLFHAPSYTAPLGGVRPLVLTIHDVSYERHPEWYPYNRDPLRRVFYRWSAGSADRIITDSGFSKEEIVAAYRLPPDRIDVVPLAAAASFDGQGGTASSPPYLLHVGDLHVRRNLDTVVRAVARLRARRPDLQALRIVLAGVDRGVRASLETLAREVADASVIDARGPVSDEELRGLYRHAAALAYPSLYEGFGLPLLEAMHCGLPVIASRAASIPEVTGDAALLVEPMDVGAWAAAIERALDRDEATRMRASSRRQAARFTWERTAAETLAVYRRAMESR